MMVTKTIIGAYSPMKMEQMSVMVERLETGFLQKAEILLLSFFSQKVRLTFVTKSKNCVHVRSKTFKDPLKQGSTFHTFSRNVLQREEGKNSMN